MFSRICFGHVFDRTGLVAIGGQGGEAHQNGTKSRHLDCLGGPGGEMVQNGTESNHVDRLGDPGGEIV